MDSDSGIDGWCVWLRANDGISLQREAIENGPGGRRPHPGTRPKHKEPKHESPPWSIGNLSQYMLPFRKGTVPHVEICKREKGRSQCGKAVN
jgi:hypothetical protein